MFTLRKKSKQSGFTLMELLIVIAILGLLLGLIAPRLGGITASTADNVCDTNNKGIRGMTAMFQETNGRLPGNLTNMVVETAAGTGTLPSVQTSTTEDEEVLSASFAGRNFPGLYTLEAEDVQELTALGVNGVIQLVGHDGTNARPDFKDTLGVGDEVMMMGVNWDGTTATVVNTDDAAYGDLDVAGGGVIGASEVGNPDWIGRIMMAVNDECELITSGLITASALCPTAVLADGMFSHEEFFIILPRLAHTAENTDIRAALTGSTAYADLVWNADNETTTAAVFVDSSNTASGRLLEVTFDAQEAWQFEVACPEGHKWPAADADAWVANP